MGFLKESVFQIPFIPFISINDLLLLLTGIITLGIAFLSSGESRKAGGFSMKRIVTWLIIIVFIRLVFNLFEYPLFEAVKNYSAMLNYFSFFFFLTAFKNDEEMERVFKGMQILLMIGLTSFMIQYLFQLDFNWKFEYSEEFGARVRHVIFPMAIIFGLYSFAALITSNPIRSRLFNIAMFIGCSVIIYLSFYRNYYLTYPLGLLVIFLTSVLKNKKKVVPLLKYSAILAIVFLIMGGLGVFELIDARLSSISNEIAHNSGTFAVRFLIWEVKYDAISQINPLFGIGFAWDTSVTASPGDSDYISMLAINNPLNIDTDNGYATILVVLGFVGIFIYLLMHLRMLMIARSLLRKSLSEFHKSITLTAIGFVCYVLISNFGLDNFYWPYAVIPNMFLFAILHYVHTKHFGDESIQTEPVNTMEEMSVVNNTCP
ncbi:MAG TPA: O-antigen ligase family protein [Bacteroidota bacterium]|nr:O-antigen ligase family protein [Bacteroidota bacterium]